MLIPAGQECSTGTWPETESEALLPHGFLYPLDIPSIHRVLRPIKGKIAAIRRDIKSSPTFRFFMEGQDVSVAVEKFNAEHKSTQRRRVHSARELTQEQQQLLHTKSQRSKQPPFQFEGDERLAEPCTEAAEILIKRYQSSLASLFKDVLNRLWWRPYCDNNDLPLNNMPCTKTTRAIRHQYSSLAIYCAFSIGQTISHIKDERKMEMYYDSIPPHLRRFALLSHLVELCVCQIPIPQIKFHLAEICVKYRADDQALRFLDDLLHPTTGGFFRLDLLRAYQLVRLTDLSDKWVELVCEHASTMRHRVVSLSQLVYHAKKRHQSILACALIDLIVAESSTRPPLRSLTLDRQRMTDWAVSLIADSLEINNAQAEDSSDYFEEHKGSSPHCDEIISRIARTLYTHPEAMVASGLEQITLALALHTLYLQFIADSQVPDLHNDTILELAMVIDERTKNVNEDDLDVVLRAFRTLPNLLVLVQVLDATELYSLAITLLDRMIYDFAQLRKTTNTLLGDNSQGHSITVRSLEALIDEIEQRRLAAAEASGWRFDYDLGHWVQQDSDQMESAAINTNTSSERHDSIFPDDDGDDQYINTEQWMERRPATRSVTHGNRRLSLFSSASPRKPPSTTKRQHQPSKASYNDGDNCVDFEKDPNDFDRLLSFTGGRDDPDRTSSSHRFSMAPYRRPIRSTRKQVRYFDMDDARDSDSDEAHSLMDSSSGGTDMEESSQEVSLDTMESPSVDYIGESEDEEMNMDAEDASLINDTSLIEGLSGWHFESLPRTCSPELKSADLSPASQHESWSEQYEEEPESLDGDNVQRFDSENFSPPSNMQQSMALESSSSSDSSGEESDMWLPTPITRKEGTRKRQRKKRKTDGREDVWSSSDSSGSSSGSREEVYPRTRCAPSPTRRQPPKRRFKPVVEITHCRSRGGGVSKNSMSGGMHIHRGSSQVYLGDTHPIEQNIEDDENGVPCLERRKQEPSLRAGLSTITSHAEQASKQAFDDLYHEIEQMENDDEDSECFASDSDEEWLPRARQKQRRRPKQISSSERDQRLLLAVGEPLPLTEADELAF